MTKKPTKAAKAPSILRQMPPLVVDPHALQTWGAIWRGVDGSLNKAGIVTNKKADRFDKNKAWTLE